VILAAQLNQFEILQMLLKKDATIEKPHKFVLLQAVFCLKSKAKSKFLILSKKK
jgi:hypothetical protein